MPRLIAGLAAVLVLAACQDAVTPPPVTPEPGGTQQPPAPTLAPSDVAGTYRATTFTTKQTAGTTDQLAAGASLDLGLQVSAATTGRLFIPDAAEDGRDFEANLAGTWTLRRDTVLFQHGADTFVRDMPFVYSSGTMTGERTFTDVTVRVVLTRQ